MQIAKDFEKKKKEGKGDANQRLNVFQNANFTGFNSYYLKNIKKFGQSSVVKYPEETIKKLILLHDFTENLLGK